MRTRLARALIVSLDTSVERVLERFWVSSVSNAGMATVTELRPACELASQKASRLSGNSGDAE